MLGYLPADGFAGGRMHLDVAAAEAAIRTDVAEPLGVDVVDAAWGIERIVNANMANATRKVLAGHGADPRRLALIAYGGNGAVHARAIARELGIDRILVPKAAPAFSALGVLVADYVVDLVRSYVTPLSQVDLGRLRSLMSELAEETGKELEPAGLEPHATQTALYVQMCYPGQNFDMSVPVPEGTALDEAGLARPRRAVPRPARGGARLLLPQPAAGRARRADRRARHDREARPLRRAGHGHRRPRAPGRARARRSGAPRGSTRRCTTVPRSERAPRSTVPR